MCQGQISFRKIQTHASFNACSCYMKVSEGSNKKQQRKSGNTIFPIIMSIGVFLRRSRAANSDLVVRSGRNSKSFIILCMSLLPASLKKIGSISTEITWWHRFFRRSRAANSVVSGGICPKFKLKHISFYVCPHYLQVWKGSDQKQPRKRDDIDFLDAQGQLTP